MSNMREIIQHTVLQAYVHNRMISKNKYINWNYLRTDQMISE